MGKSHSFMLIGKLVDVNGAASGYDKTGTFQELPDFDLIVLGC